MTALRGCQRQHQQRLSWARVSSLIALAATASSSWSHVHAEKPKRLYRRSKTDLLPWGVGQQISPRKDCKSSLLLRTRGGSDYDPNYSDPRQRPSYDDYNDDYKQGGAGYGSDSYYQESSVQDEDWYGGGGRGNRGDYEDEYFYDDRGTSPSESSRGKRRSGAPGAASSFIDSMPSIFKNGDRRIGLTLLGAGSVVTMLGMSLFFNKALLRLGNLLFISGVMITMGISRTMGFFLKPEKMRATACLGLGIFLVFIGSPVFGMILEIFGLLNLFGNMFPMLLAIGKTLPGIGPLLNNLDKNRNSNGNNRRKSSRDEERYYNSERDYYDERDDRDYYNDGGRGYDDDQGYY